MRPDDKERFAARPPLPPPGDVYQPLLHEPPPHGCEPRNSWWRRRRSKGAPLRKLRGRQLCRSAQLASGLVARTAGLPGSLCSTGWHLSCCLSNPTPDRETAPTTEELQRRTLLSSGINLSKAIMGVGERAVQYRLWLGHIKCLGRQKFPAGHIRLPSASQSPHPGFLCCPAIPGILALPRVFSLLGIGTATLWLAFIGGPAAPAAPPPLCVPSRVCHSLGGHSPTAAAAPP